MPDKTKVLIAGAGPAGIITSLFLARYRISHLLIDKARFPRDKICGDALSGKVVDVLDKLDPDFVREIRGDQSRFLPCYGVKFVAPGGSFIDIPFTSGNGYASEAKGFISKRQDFDEYLFRKIDRSYASVSEDTTVTDLVRTNDGIHVSLNHRGNLQTISARMIVGAEGDRSIVGRKLARSKNESRHYCAGLRAYYTGVKDLHQQNYIELHFLKDLLPGYFWIFPLPDGHANVGIGMLSEAVSEKKINLREKMLSIIQDHPSLKERFRNAEPLGDIKGWGLPLGSKKRKISGDNFLLTGDAASLIDPFTGEGIGNAMISGMIAAEAIRNALETNDFTSTALENSYDKKIYDLLWSELRLSHTLQRLTNQAWLFNLVVKKASRNKTVRDTITCMFEDVGIRASLKKPSFYLKLLFN